MADTEYTLTTSANVSVMGSFYGDDPSDNSGQVKYHISALLNGKGSLLL